MGLGFRESGPECWLLTLITGPWSQSSSPPRPERLGPVLLLCSWFRLWLPWTSCAGHLPFPSPPSTMGGEATLRERPGSSLSLFVVTDLAPHLTLLPCLLQTFLHTPETEKPVPHRPPTPTPLAIATTVTTEQNATVLQVGGGVDGAGPGGGVVKVMIILNILSRALTLVLKLSCGLQRLRLLRRMKKEVTPPWAPSSGQQSSLSRLSSRSFL